MDQVRVTHIHSEVMKIDKDQQLEKDRQEKVEESVKFCRRN